MTDDIQELLDEINILHNELVHYRAQYEYKRLLTMMYGVYALYLAKMFYRNRNITQVRATDILFITYTSAFMRMIGW